MEGEKYPFWTTEELEELREEALQRTIKRYLDGRDRFAEIQGDCRAKVQELFDATDYLRTLGQDKDLFKQAPSLEAPARYTTMPAISAGNLEVVGEKDGPIATIVKFLDRDRFPWLGRDGSRPATETEIELAIHVTAQLWAEARMQTESRTKSAKDQEQEVRDRLTAAGLQYVAPKEIRERLNELGDKPAEGLMPNNYQEVLKRNEFTREIHVAGAKCDVPIRLPNGRLLPIECKVSNTYVNSVKRLIRESVGKGDSWRQAFSNEIHTGVVIAGAFKMVNLQAAQAKGTLIFFDHNLEALDRFLQAGGVPRLAG